MRESQHDRWLVLIHQLPPKPNYFRVKIWRRLQQLGAMAIKNSVYVLPNTEQAHESFEWLMREIVAGGGEASLCEARFVEGLTDDQIVQLFRKVRHAEYQALIEQGRQLLKTVTSRHEGDQPEREGELTRLKRRLAAVIEVDVFGAPGRQQVEQLLQHIELRLRHKPSLQSAPLKRVKISSLKGCVWVTRKHVYVDRMASAWLIRRFLDKDARFKFVAEKRYRPLKKELRFDMFEAEFTHEGDRCTFEVLLERTGLRDPALQHIAELVHEVDLKDGKFSREDVAGFERVLSSIAQAHRHDETRLERSAAVLDDLYAYFRASMTPRSKA